jgi:hypothetical protein
MVGDLMLHRYTDGEGRMATLHIEHAISDLETWLGPVERRRTSESAR